MNKPMCLINCPSADQKRCIEYLKRLGIRSRFFVSDGAGWIEIDAWSFREITLMCRREKAWFPNADHVSSIRLLRVERRWQDVLYETTGIRVPAHAIDAGAFFRRGAK